MDLAIIIKKIRTLNYFMKMILDVDQRKLPKLRSRKYISSDEELYKPDIFSYKKITDRQQMLRLYVENLRSKAKDRRDIKLLQITGLQNVVDLLKQREAFRMQLKNRRVRQKEVYMDGVNFDDLRDVIGSTDGLNNHYNSSLMNLNRHINMSS